jgi:heme/copper-type cytochrome/quinol oxidase subunit 2
MTGVRWAPDAPSRLMLLYDVSLAVAAVVFVVVAAFVGWSIVRYRDIPDGHERPGPYQNVRLDLLWWALPTALVIVLFLLTAQVLGAADVPTRGGS